MMCMLIPSMVLAQGGAGATGGAGGGGGAGATGGTTSPNPNIIQPVIKNPLNDAISSGGIPGIIEAVMRGIVMPLASVLVVLALLYSGFKFVMAQGNATEIQKARDGLVWVLIGSAVLLGAYGISEFLKNTINDIVKVKV